MTICKKNEWYMCRMSSNRLRLTKCFTKLDTWTESLITFNDLENSLGQKIFQYWTRGCPPIGFGDFVWHPSHPKYFKSNICTYLNTIRHTLAAPHFTIHVQKDHKLAIINIIFISFKHFHTRMSLQTALQLHWNCLFWKIIFINCLLQKCLCFSLTGCVIVIFWYPICLLSFFFHK